MADDDWYRRTTWTDEDLKAFFARLKRSRSDWNRSQYLAIQGMTLADEGYFSEAIELLTQVVVDFPDQKIHSAMSYCTIAKCYAELQSSEKAIENFRKALEEERAFPNVRTGTWLDYPWYVISTEQTELYSEALAIILEFEEDHSLNFPVEIFRWSAIKSIITEFLGDHAASMRFAQKAFDASKLESSGFRYHQKLGLVKEIEPQIRDRLQKILIRG